MRPQQQNRRMRGRNNNPNRKGPNPLTRSYESNGPDVKIRGSAQQIAEKYATLARDAMSSGDRVMAENYLQHAEHYNRIIAAAQAQMPIQHQSRENRDDMDDELDDEREDFDAPQQQEARSQNHQQQQQQSADGSGPQPVIEGVPAEVALSQGAAGDGESDHRVNGARSNGAEHEDGQASRRQRRPRRGRGRPDFGAVEGSGQGGEQGEGASASAPEAPEAAE